MGTKETAVEWLENELAIRQSIIDSEPEGFVKQIMYANLYLNLFEKAKEMEKENTLHFGAKCCIMTTQKNDWTLENLYNETFNK